MILYVCGSVQILYNRGREGRGRVVVKCLSLLEKMAKDYIKMVKGGGGSKIGQNVIT